MLYYEVIDLSKEASLIRPFYDKLVFDEHHPDKCRYRRFAQFRIENGCISRLELRPFIQPKKSNKILGGRPRYHEPVDRNFPVYPIIFSGLRMIGDYDETWLVNIHQIRIVTDQNIVGSVVPEGPHQDGALFIMLVCIDRQNVGGGETWLTEGGDGEPVLRRVFTPGEGVILNDRKYFHYVTDIEPIEDSPGHRDILIVGFHKWADKHYGKRWEEENIGREADLSPLAGLIS